MYGANVNMNIKHALLVLNVLIARNILHIESYGFDQSSIVVEVEINASCAVSSTEITLSFAVVLWFFIINPEWINVSNSPNFLRLD